MHRSRYGSFKVCPYQRCVRVPFLNVTLFCYSVLHVKASGTVADTKGKVSQNM